MGLLPGSARPTPFCVCCIYATCSSSKTAFSTTNYIITELVALLSSRYHLPRQQVIKVINAIKADIAVEVVYIEKSTDDEAWALLESRLDKEWSLVDASSFIVMKQFGMTQALTTDHHFTQAGFIKVPTLLAH